VSKITIIITAHQDRGWIDDAILSAKNQIFRDYDIVFYSNGNPGLKRYAEKHGLKFILNLNSNGLNSMINSSEGEWIKILHDDDLLVPDSLESLLKYSEGADLVYGDAIYFKNNDLTSGIHYVPPKEVSVKTFFPVFTNPINWPSVMFRKDSFIKVGGFDTNVKYAGDYDLYLNFLSNSLTFKYCPEVVIWFRQHKNQHSGHDSGNKAKGRQYLMKKYIND